MEFKLLIKKIHNKLSQKEEDDFLKWYQESDQHKKYFDSVKKDIQNNEMNPDLIAVEKGWHIIETKLKFRKKKIEYYHYGIAVSLFAIIMISFLVNEIHKSTLNENTVVAYNPILPGENKAVLTLEDGSDIILEKGEKFTNDYFESSGDELIHNHSKLSKENKYNYLTVPRGGQYSIQLSDGTEVFLNSESKLKFPVTFLENQDRKVELLYGEAYFDVSPSIQHNGTKFEVLTKNQNIEVLGTEFNVKAYEDESFIYTTLVEGTVLIQNENHKKILKPNEQCSFDIVNKSLQVSKVNIIPEIAWIKGEFVFFNKPLGDITKVLSRWYNANFVFENKEKRNVKFNGELNKNQKIEEILDLLEKTKIINAYDINDKTIILK